MDRPAPRPADARGGRRRLLRAGTMAVALLCVAMLTAPAAWAASVSCDVQPDAVLFGDSVTVQGTVTATTRDEVVSARDVIVLVSGVEVATTVTDANGQFSISFNPRRGGNVVVRLEPDGIESPAVPLEVRPRISTQVVRATMYGTATLSVRISPSSYRGQARAVVEYNGKRVGNVVASVTGASTTLRVPTPGVGRFDVTLTTSEWGGLSSRSVDTVVNVVGPRLVVGSSGPNVRSLLTQLAKLHFRVPGISSYLSSAAADSIMAFQKAYGLPRTYIFDTDDWRKLGVAKVVRPRYSSPRVHIEIDKRRQILMVVKNGEAFGILAVSTGASGNTPEGRHAILWKAYSAPTPYGPGLLYWDMEFHPSFAMHAYPFVPPYPASHGCVRQPTWVAPWTYGQSYVGETVYVYR